MLKSFPTLIGLDYYNPKWTLAEKRMYGKKSKKAVVNWFKWRPEDVPASYVRYLDFKTQDILDIYQKLDGLKKLIGGADKLEQIFAPYGRNPGELIDVLQREHESKETLTEALKSIKCSMIVFLRRLYIDGYNDELKAIRDICGRVYHRNIIVKFVSDPKAVENLQSKKRSYTSEEKKAFLRTRFQERSVKST